SGRPELRAPIERAQRFLALTALLAAVLAGVAIALGTRRYVERHLDGCAVMRCLGATQGALVRLYAGEFALLGVIACAIGAALGLAALAALLIWQAGDLKLGVYVVGGFAGAVLVFYAVAWLALAMLSRLRVRNRSLRYGLANLRRHARGNALQVASLALGLTA